MGPGSIIEQPELTHDAAAAHLPSRYRVRLRRRRFTGRHLEPAAQDEVGGIGRSTSLEQHLPCGQVGPGDEVRQVTNHGRFGGMELLGEEIDDP